MIRIGVNALYLIPGEVGGTEVYLRNLLNALASVDGENHYFVFRNRETGTNLVPQSARFHDCPQAVNGRSRPARILYEQTMLPWNVKRLRIDVLLNAGFTAPLVSLCPMVTVFHDLQYQRHPEWFRPWDLPFWRVLLPRSAACSRSVVVLSQAVRDDLVKFYRYSPSRIDVIPHGVEPRFEQIAAERRKHSPDTKTLLCVSTLHPHKNLGLLLTAFHRFLQGSPGWKLYLVGLKGFETEKIERRREELGLSASVTVTGWIPREDLYRLFAIASAFIYPSQFEGFGIPVLEAISAGIPTACSRIPSLVEIADGAVRFFDPSSLDDMVAAMSAVALDPEVRARLEAAGVERSLEFSWLESARRLVRVLYEATRSKNCHD